MTESAWILSDVTVLLDGVGRQIKDSVQTVWQSCSMLPHTTSLFSSHTHSRSRHCRWTAASRQNGAVMCICVMLAHFRPSSEAHSNEVLVIMTAEMSGWVLEVWFLCQNVICSKSVNKRGRKFNLVKVWRGINLFSSSLQKKAKQTSDHCVSPYCQSRSLACRTACNIPSFWYSMHQGELQICQGTWRHRAAGGNTSS